MWQTQTLCRAASQPAYLSRASSHAPPLLALPGFAAALDDSLTEESVAFQAGAPAPAAATRVVPARCGAMAILVLAGFAVRLGMREFCRRRLDCRDGGRAHRRQSDHRFHGRRCRRVHWLGIGEKRALNTRLWRADIRRNRAGGLLSEHRRRAVVTVHRRTAECGQEYPVHTAIGGHADRRRLETTADEARDLRIVLTLLLRDRGSDLLRHLKDRALGARIEARRGRRPASASNT